MKSLPTINPLPYLSIRWNDAYGSNAVNLQRFYLANSIFISVSPMKRNVLPSLFNNCDISQL